MFTCDIFGLVS